MHLTIGQSAVAGLVSVFGIFFVFNWVAEKAEKTLLKKPAVKNKCGGWK